VLVRELWANLRARSDSRFPVMLTVYIGTRLEVAGHASGWVELRLPDGGKGWTEEHRVQRYRADEPPWPPEHEALVCTARRFLGIPYLWGGCTPVGLDCSGFVQLVFGLHGIPLRRDASEQAAQGGPVELDALQTADLVFFGDRCAESPRITHVGMMLDGRRFIHARGGQCVRIDDVREDHWSRRVVSARRHIHG
jgi:hypothetical protein